jgi:hypothetical protein
MKGGDIMKLLQKIGTGIATGVMLAGIITPSAFAATSVTVSGNGAGSVNTVNVTSSNTTSVSQTNVAQVSNNVVTNNNTGNNSASFNTGGTTVVHSGSSTSNVSITNLANANFLRLSKCWKL